MGTELDRDVAKTMAIPSNHHIHPMIIRRFSPDDLTVYRDLRLECAAANPSAVRFSYAEESALSLDQMRERLVHTPQQATFGAFDGATLVAMAGFSREQRTKAQHRGDIFGVYVAPAARGTGLSRQLLEALLDHVRTTPEVVVVTLAVRTTNDAARALYRRLGFCVTGIDKRALFVDGTYHDEERMTLDLDAA